jgi:diguanylate cyclase (GGDEF)-like protein
MGENFAFFLPVMMASFGVAFLIICSWHVRAAAWWSAAFFCIAAGFSAPLGFAALPSPFWSIVANLLFATGFLLFSQALLQRWRPSWLLAVRLTIWSGSILLCALAHALGNLPLELAASDFGCFLLIGLSLIAAKDHLRCTADRALFAAASLVALDNLVRGSTVPLTLRANGDFLNSEYAFLMQALACIFGLFLALSALATQVMDLLARYQREAMVDPLSGLFNRRGFDDAVTGVRTDGHRGGSLIVCDIDHFKAVNDEYGHALGDKVIIALSQLLTSIAPTGAIAARFGGEEFVLFLPGIDAARAAEIANKLREGFTNTVAEQLHLSRALTASFGLSTTQRSDTSIHDTIARADEALYEAKARGRNRVRVRRALSSPTVSKAPSPRIVSA